jgi:hypothetical protein
MTTSNKLSVSTAPAAVITGKPYYDLPGTIAFMHRLFRNGLVDGFEFQNLAEWNAANPPRTDTGRHNAWRDSSKYTTDEISLLLKESNLPVFSIHANRDVGVFLCSKEEKDITYGRQLIHESMSLATQVNAPVCVFHIWDTMSESFDLDLLKHTIDEISPQYPGVIMAIENVPTRLPGFTPFTLAREFDWVTLDIKWAAFYDEFEKFESIRDQIVNIHLRGNLSKNRWVLPDSPFTFYDALNTIRSDWHYTGLITMEPGDLKQARYSDFEQAMASLR